MIQGTEKTTLFLGNFGSGKSEVAVNFAFHVADSNPGLGVSLADLDLVNPYFRSREARELLAEAGINLVLPDARYLDADLPILVPGVRALLMAGNGYAVLDVGGDDVGARVLGALTDALVPGSYRALQVVNANRPFTRTPQGVLKIASEIEYTSFIKFTGYVCNTHLMEQTTMDDILAGVKLVREVQEVSGLPLEFVTAPEAMVPELRQHLSEEILPLKRFLTPPWKQPDIRGPMGKVIRGL
jgi:hypothetical protein